MTHDLVVAGGHVLCPATGVNAVADVALDDGRIAAVGEDCRAASASTRAACWSCPG